MKIIFKTVNTFSITASTAFSMIFIATGVGVLTAIILAVSVVRATTMGIMVIRARKIFEKSSRKKQSEREQQPINSSDKLHRKHLQVGGVDEKN